MLEDTVDITEIGLDEAPHACLVRTSRVDRDFRFIDGAFHQLAENKPHLSKGVRLDPELQRRLTIETLVEIAIGASGPISKLWPDEAKPFLRNVRKELGGFDSSDRDKADHDAALPGGGISIPIERLDAVEESHLEFWREKALARIGSSYVVEGRMSLRVPEPLIAYNDARSSPVKLADMAFYSMGGHEETQQMISGSRNSWRMSHDYWDWTTEIFSMDELGMLESTARQRAADDGSRAERLRSTLADLSMIEVSDPSLFGVGFAERELVRQARNAIENIPLRFCDDKGWLDWVPRELRKAYRHVKDMIPLSRPVVDIQDGLDDAVSALAVQWHAESAEAEHCKAEDSERMPGRMLAAVERWRSRPISVEFGVSPVSARSGP